MASKQIVKPCDICNEVTMHIQQTPNHILHLLLSLVTCGLWLIVWIIIGCCIEAPVCSKCGNIPKQGTVQEEKKAGLIELDVLMIENQSYKADNLKGRRI